MVINYCPPRIVMAKPLTGRGMWVVYADGTQGIVDLKPLMQGHPYDNVRENDTLFANVVIDYGTLTWPDGTDIAPELVYENLDRNGVIEVPAEFSRRISEVLKP